MIQSMTGFGRAAVGYAGMGFEIEARSVNHRYLDVRLRVPRILAPLEADLRARVQGRFQRGRIDVTIASPESGVPPPRLELDLEVARQYLRAAETLREKEAVKGELEVARLLALPGVARFVEPEQADEGLLRELWPAFDAALDAVAAMRAAEGESLERELLGRTDRVAQLANELEKRAGAVVEAARLRLRRRSEQLASETGLLDEARLHQEIVIAADRMDVTEELVRLRSHVDQFRTTIAAGAPDQPVGRRLEFLLQELGREANTVGSKAGDAPVAHLAVELKGELERLREQVQNVE